MKILENYINAVKALERHFGVENLSSFPIEIKDDYFYVSDYMEEVSWAETVYDLESDGDYSLEEIKNTVTTEKLTLFRVPSKFGDGDYYIIFKNKNRVEIE